MKKLGTQKVLLQKKTLKNLTVQSNVKAGGCSKQWSYNPSHGPNGCSGTTVTK